MFCPAEGLSGGRIRLSREVAYMAFFDSRVSRFLIQDAGGTKRDLSAFVVDVRGLPGARALNEVTALGDSGARFIPGLQDGVFSLSGLFDNTDVHRAGRGAGRAALARRGGGVRVRAGGDGDGGGEVLREVLGGVLRAAQPGRAAGGVGRVAAGRRRRRPGGVLAWARSTERRG